MNSRQEGEDNDQFGTKRVLAFILLGVASVFVSIVFPMLWLGVDQVCDAGLRDRFAWLWSLIEWLLFD